MRERLGRALALRVSGDGFRHPLLTSVIGPVSPVCLSVEATCCSVEGVKDESRLDACDEQLPREVDGERLSRFFPHSSAGGIPGEDVAPMQPRRDGEGGLAHVVKTLPAQGARAQCRHQVSVAGVELLGVRLRAASASFETAARYGLEFPSGVDTETVVWRQTREAARFRPDEGDILTP